MRNIHWTGYYIAVKMDKRTIGIKLDKYPDIIVNKKGKLQNRWAKHIYMNINNVKLCYTFFVIF